jgi:site-specific recombinase XerD
MESSQIRVVEGRLLEEWIESWLGSLTKGTSRVYRTDAICFLDWFGSRDVSLVTRSDCQRYRASLLETSLAPATINRKMAVVRSMLAESVRHDIRTDNPASGVKGYRSDGISKHSSAPTVEQVRALLESIGDEKLIDARDRAMIYMLATLGLRREEITDLKLSDIGEDHGRTVLTIVGKGHKTRCCAIPTDALAAVRAWIDRAQLSGDVPLLQAINNDQLTGRTLHVNTVYAVVGRRLAAAGIAGCTTHSFRRFLITEGLRNGCPLYKMQRFVGHSDPRTTEGYDVARGDIEESAGDYVRIEPGE